MTKTKSKKVEEAVETASVAVEAAPAQSAPQPEAVTVRVVKPVTLSQGKTKETKKEETMDQNNNINELLQKLEAENAALKQHIATQSEQYNSLLKQNESIAAMSNKCLKDNEALVAALEKISKTANEAKKDTPAVASSSSSSNEWIVPALVGAGVTAAVGVGLYFLLQD